MAWQLVYTSAPRLLEAGRSGFGTVARHRQISPLLVSAIERSSQFARLPGMDAGRVVFSHRIVAAGGGRFHVLSCIRDAGADYTGRTNHLGHHLVVEPREAAQATAAGITPAAVLLAASWRQRWDDPPRYFDASEEIDIARLASGKLDGQAWTRLTGNPENAWLLAAGEASRGAWLITPSSADLRMLFAESQELAPDRAWQTTFTTSLQPTDEIADFCWLGVEPLSPLFAQTHRGTRPTLDLTAPASLPPPQVPAVKGPPAPLVPPAATPPAPSFQTAPQAPIFTPAGRVRVALGAPRAARTNPTAADPFSRDKSAAAHSSRRWIMALSLAAIVAVGGFYVAHTARDRLETKRRQTELLDSVRASGLFNSETVANLQSAIASVPSERLTETADFIHSSVETMRSLETPELPPLSKARVDVLQDKARAAGLSNIPDEIRAAAEILDKAEGLDRAHTTFPVSGSSDKAYESDVARQRSEIEDLIKASPLERKRLAAVENFLRMGVNRSAATALRKLLRGKITPLSGEGWFRAQIAALQPADRQTNAVLEQVKGVLDDWSAGLGKTNKWRYKPNAEDAREFPWLFVPAPGRENDPHETIASSEPVSAHVSRKAETALYFTDTKARASQLHIAELSHPLDFELLPPGGPVTKMAFNSNGTIRKNFQSDQDGFKISSDTLQPEEKSPAPPFTIVGRDKTSGTPVVSVTIRAPHNGEPLFGHAPGGIQLKDGILAVEIPPSVLEGSVHQPLWLELPPSFDGHSTAAHAEALDHLTLNVSGEIKAAKDAAKAKDDAWKQAQKALADFDARSSSVKTTIDMLRKRRTFSKDAEKRLAEAQKCAPPQACDKLLKAIATDWGETWKNTDFAKADDVFKAGEKLATAKTPPEVDFAVAEALNKIRALRLGAKTKDQQDGPSAILGIVETELNSLRTSDKNVLQKNVERAAIDAKAAQSTPLFNSKLPVGAYRLFVDIGDGQKLLLLVFDVL